MDEGLYFSWFSKDGNGNENQTVFILNVNTISSYWVLAYGYANENHMSFDGNFELVFC